MRKRYIAKIYLMVLLFIYSCTGIQKDAFQIDDHAIKELSFRKNDTSRFKRILDQKSVDSFLNMVNGCSWEPMIFKTNYQAEIVAQDTTYVLGINDSVFHVEGKTFRCPGNLEKYVVRYLKDN